jgi:hypothetical protein
MGEQYRITLKGQIAPHWSEWLAGLTVLPLEDGKTCLEGEIQDQAALHGLLEKIRDLNLTLLGVERLADA